MSHPSSERTWPKQKGARGGIKLRFQMNKAVRNRSSRLVLVKMKDRGNTGLTGGIFEKRFLV